jgi:phosphoglycerate dehydrogenase-like enzyme
VTERILVLHDAPQELQPLFARRCPGAAVRFAASPAEVGPALSEHAPTCVFSIKHSGFPGPAHRPVATHPTVRWVHVGGSGFEHLGVWDPTAVTVTNSAGVLAPFLAETALAAMLSLAVGLPAYAADQAQRVWAPRRFTALAGRTLLVVGVGRVGGELAQRARALGMRVLGVRASGGGHPSVERMVGPEGLAGALGEADVVSLHVRLDASTKGLFGPAEIAAMKPGALLMNSARGGVLDEAALVTALRSGHLAGAWLDVFAEEPLPRQSPLWGLPNVLVTPHCADQVQDFPLRFAEHFCDLRDALLRGEPLLALRPAV